MRIALTTLGCKINQFETDVMRQDLLARGNMIVPFSSEADVYIINTCSVTAKSDLQSKHEIRSAIRHGKGAATIVVTGCYAETQPGEIRNIPGVKLVFGNRDKTAIVDHIMSTAAAGNHQDQHYEANIQKQALHGKSRGFLKIQDGCDNRCSYCIVPLARGGSRSVSPVVVSGEFVRLVEAGYPEVVLSGIHIGKYGSDLGTGITLTEMLKKLLSERKQTRIRLSSIEPREITDELIDLLGRGLCRHLHVPLQSGDDAILSSMKRNYTSGFYQNLLNKISQRVPGTALGADIMVGFPGEGENEFQNTLRLVAESSLTHLHVFSFSSRRGTPAADMKSQVPDQVKKDRREALLVLGSRKNLEFRKKCLGAEHTVVVENKVDTNTGCYEGLTDNYLRVRISGSKQDHIGKAMKVRIKEVNETDNIATIL